MLVAAVTPAALEPRADAGCRKTSVKGGSELRSWHAGAVNLGSRVIKISNFNILMNQRKA